MQIQAYYFGPVLFLAPLSKLLELSSVRLLSALDSTPFFFHSNKKLQGVSIKKILMKNVLFGTFLEACRTVQIRSRFLFHNGKYFEVAGHSVDRHIQMVLMLT